MILTCRLLSGTYSCPADHPILQRYITDKVDYATFVRLKGWEWRMSDIIRINCGILLSDEDLLRIFQHMMSR